MVSIIGWILASALKARVSSESMDVPDGQPATSLGPPMRRNGEASMGSGDAPTTTILPPDESPPSAALIALELVTVERMTLAPPSDLRSAATSPLVLSI